MDKEYYLTLNGWRFIFSLLIVWTHLPNDWKGISAYYNYGNTIVLIFFILSGFLIGLKYKSHFENDLSYYREFIIKRSATIFPLQWLMTLLFSLFSINIVTYWAIPFNLTLTQSLVPFWEINFSINVPAWFLSSIFICYLLTPFVLLFSSKNSTLFISFYLSVVICWNLFILVLPDSIGTRWLCYINPLCRFIDFTMGIILSLYWKEIKKISMKLLNGKVVSTVLEIMIIVAIFICFIDESLQNFNDFTFIRYPLILLFLIIFSLSSGLLSKILSSKIFYQLGELSIAIYMSHIFVLYFIKKIDLSSDSKIILTYIFTILFASLLVRYYCPYMQKKVVKLLTKK